MTIFSKKLKKQVEWFDFHALDDGDEMQRSKTAEKSESRESHSCYAGDFLPSAEMRVSSN